MSTDEDAAVSAMRAAMNAAFDQMREARAQVAERDQLLDALLRDVADAQRERDAARAALALYLSTYADTQTHPTASQETKVIMAARDALASPPEGALDDPR